MHTTISTKGQIVLPGPLRRRLGLHPGDPLEVNVESGRIVLTPRRQRRRTAKIVTDAVTGLPVLTAGPEAPTLSSKEVEEILASFP